MFWKEINWRNYMNILNEIMNYNKKFVEEKLYESYIAEKKPAKKVVILSCMDTRLTELLPKAMNLKNGDAKIIKNAGATVMHPFGSIMRSIIVAIYQFDVKDVIVAGHYGCGMSNLDGKELMEKINGCGINSIIFDTLRNSGIDVVDWLHGFESEMEAVKESVDIIKNHPLVADEIRVHGVLMDPKTGRIDIVIDGNKI